MKKMIFLIVMLIGITICISGCSSFVNKGILRGYIDKDEHFDKEGFRDYTDYCKYFYKKSNKLFIKSDLYSEVKEEDIENIRSYFTDFKSWIDIENRSNEYDFNDSCISKGDYIYIETKEGQPIGESKYEKFDSYSICFYDTESATLFYIHSNN